MNKLERNLEIFLNPMKISKEGVEYWDFTNINSIKPLAEEVKKIAVEFNKWVESNFYRQPFTQEYSIITNDPTLWPENFRRVNIEELFDKFIEEYYV